MLVLYRLSSLDTALASSSFNLLNTRMHDLKPVQSPLKLWAQAIVCLNTAGEDSVTSDLRFIQDVQEGGSWWLSLIRYIAVPRHGASS